MADAGELLPLAAGVEEVGAPAVGDIPCAGEKVEVVHALLTVCYPYVQQPSCSSGRDCPAALARHHPAKVGNVGIPPAGERAMTRPAKRITSIDIARAAGVSQTTVSFVLNDKPGHSIPEATRLRILEVARQLDYRPHGSARALAAGRSDIVLLSVPDLPIGGAISRFIEEMASALADQGLALVTHLAGAHGRPLADVCAMVNASVVIGFTSFDEDTVQALYRAGADVVLPSHFSHDWAGRPVGRLQARHLIGRGHRRIGYAMPAHPGLREMGENRLAGVADACAGGRHRAAGRAQHKPGDRGRGSSRGGVDQSVSHRRVRLQ